ncbi:DMT family transporter [Roseomonas sp. CCTCC AB2023176]|uniref:DMT family transporter n=1 Tax=Roseomonas sp. CCTCC AB2023176 TaxID=3342640 RepID=UPI0035E31EC4
MHRDLRLLAIAVVLFGGAWPITKDALRDATPLWFASARAGFAALALAFVMALARRLAMPGRADWPAIVALATLQLGGFFALSHLGIALLPAGRTAILSNVTIPFLVPLSVAFLGERVSAMRWLSAAFGMAGALVLVGPWSVDWSRGEVVLAHLYLLAAALAWSVAIVVVRRFPPGKPMVELLPFSFGLGALLILIPLAMVREPAGGIGWSSMPHALFIGLIAAPLGTWSVIEAGRRLPSTVASVGFLFVPILGVALGTLWLAEPLGWDLWLGGALIAASMVAAVRG